MTQLGFGADGDGWVSLLQDHYYRQLNFINRGFSGYSSRHAVKYILPNLAASVAAFDTDSLPNTNNCQTSSKTPTFEPNENTGLQISPITPQNYIKFATIFYGANDSVLKSCQDNSQHVPIPEFEANIYQILTYFQENFPNLQKVILISLPKYDYENWKIITRQKYNMDFYPESKRDNSNSKLYSQALNKIQKLHQNQKSGFSETQAESNSGQKFLFDISFIDTFSAMDSVKNFEDLLVDGLHFNAKGNKFLFELLKNEFKGTVGIKFFAKRPKPTIFSRGETMGNIF